MNARGPADGPRPGLSGSGIRADAEIRSLLHGLRGDSDLVDIDEVLARAVWSRLTEPGDAVAGAVLGAIGAPFALDLLAAQAGAVAFERAFAEAGITDPSISGRQLAAALKRWYPRLDRSATLQDLQLAERSGIGFLIPGDKDWPAALDDLGTHAPHALWTRGSQTLLASQSLAVVGARACTGYGSHVTAELTSEAGAAGFTIVSGAAYGVDAVAHRTALAAEAPTIAVLAGGADRPYPAAHDRLIARVVERGTVCSELPPGSAPTRWRFLQRNRLISALARAVLVTEAGVRSGTLNTAGHAAELGRALGAVPGPITSAASAGCHRLIREYGAALITNRDDVLELLGASEILDVLGGAGARTPALHLRLLDALPLRGGRDLADAARLAGVSPQEAGEALAELELLGYVAQRSSPQTGESRWVLLNRG